LAAPGKLVEERRLVSILFVDLVGSTEQADGADPEDVRDKLRMFHARVREEIERFGGTTEKFIGDAVLAVFGAPVAHGDDAERAVRCGLAVIEAVSELGREHPELQLEVRAAVETGEAVVALGVAFERGEALATGDVVNVASRLQSAAPPARLVVGEQAHEATHRSIVYEPLPPIIAKGKPEPLMAWLAVEPAGPAAAWRGSRLSPLVGRELELDIASSAWSEVRAARTPRLVTFVGPPGIGKSRLALEIERTVVRSGGRVARGRSLPYGEDAGYGGFIQQVRSLARIHGSDPPGVAREKLFALVEPIIPGDQARTTSEHLSLLLGLESDTAVADQQVLLFAARKLVEALGSDQPIMLVFEDMHWADESLLDLVAYLVARVRDAPVLFLVLARPQLLERRGVWATLPSSETIALAPLSREDSFVLARHLTEGGGESARRLAATGEGNPLFIEELAAAESERGASQASQLPTTVRAAIVARIDALPGPARSVLLEAAVVGREFWRGALSAPEGATMDHALDVLCERDMVRVERSSRIADDQQFTFKHMLIRDVAYATLPRSVRRARHAAAADFIERTAGERLAESSATVAYHRREAGETERAVEAFILAGDTAVRGWAKEEAVALYGEALELVPEGSQGWQEVAQRKARALMASGQYQAAADLIDGLLPGLTGRAELEATLDRTRASWWLTSAADAHRFGERAAELAQSMGLKELSASALAYISQISGMEGRCTEMIRLGEEAIAIWPEEDLPAERSYELEMIGLTETWIGRYRDAEAHLVEATKIAEECHSVEAMLRSGATLGLALTGLGRHEEAIRQFDDTIARGRDLEVLPRFTARTLNMSSSALRDLQEFDAARARNEEAIELGHEATFNLAWIQGGIDLLEADLHEGEFGRAESAWPRFWDETETTRGFHQWLMTGRLLLARAWLDLELTGPEAALSSVVPAREHAERTERPKQVIACEMIAGRSLALLGKRVAALDEVTRAAAMADELGHPPTMWRAHSELARVCTMTGDDAGAESASARTRVIVEDFADGLEPGRRERFRASPSIAGIGAPPDQKG
jgi:class 3 adenylate cyclase/tetratricopeptide (TPR) repeat protein